MNNLVPVRDSAYQWKTLFTKLSEGKLPNINEISLEYEPVDGLPASVTGLDGELEAPKEAGNVIAPPPEKLPTPEAYKETVPVGTYGQGKIKDMGRVGRSTAKKKRGTRSKTGTKKRRGPATKKKGAVRKKRTTSKTKRRRKNITKP